MIKIAFLIGNPGFTNSALRFIVTTLPARLFVGTIYEIHLETRREPHWRPGETAGFWTRCARRRLIAHLVRNDGGDDRCQRRKYRGETYPDTIK